MSFFEDTPKIIRRFKTQFSGHRRDHTHKYHDTLRVLH